MHSSITDWNWFTRHFFQLVKPIENSISISCRVLLPWFSGLWLRLFRVSLAPSSSIRQFTALRPQHPFRIEFKVAYSFLPTISPWIGSHAADVGKYSASLHFIFKMPRERSWNPENEKCSTPTDNLLWIKNEDVKVDVIADRNSRIQLRSIYGLQRRSPFSVTQVSS